MSTLDGLSGGEVAVTPDARYLVFNRSPNGESDDLLRWSPATGQKLLLISNQRYPAEYSSWSYNPVGVSAGGRYAYFTSLNPHLVAGDTNRYSTDLFRYDTTTKTITRLDLTSTGAEIKKGLGIGRNDDVGSGQAAAVSCTGRWVAFSTQGSQVIPGDTNRVIDVFLRGPRCRPSRRGDDSYAHHATGSDGRSPHGGSCSTRPRPAVCRRHFADDRSGERVVSGAQANGRSLVDAVSPDGRFVLFGSWASNLVAGDTNGVRDVFFPGGRGTIVNYPALKPVSQRFSAGNHVDQGSRFA